MIDQTQIQQQPQMPQQQPPAQEPMPQQEQGGQSGVGVVAPEHLGFNQNLQNIIVTRIMETVKSDPSFGGAIDDIQPESAMELCQVVPELYLIFKELGIFYEEDGQDQGQGAEMPMAEGGAVPEATAPQLQGVSEEENTNPLTSGISRGLVG